VSDSAVADAIKLHMPEVRNRVLLLLSGKRASEISTPEGKNTLSGELMREIVQPLAGSVPAPALDSVLFTSFVIQ
jgi:flagellar FliL protein